MSLLHIDITQVVEDKELSILHSQYHGISNHEIYYVEPDSVHAH